MKRFLLVMCATLGIMGVSMAQKLVIKKSVVYVDKTTDPLASIQKLDSQTYVYKNPKGEDIFKLEEIREYTRIGKVFHVINVTDMRNGKSNNIPYESLSFAIGNETVFFAIITKGQYKLMNDKGIDYEVLDALMAEPKKDVMVNVKAINDSVNAVIEKGMAIAKEKKVSIGLDNKIYSDKKEIGNVVIKVSKDQSIYAFFSKKTKQPIGYWTNYKENFSMGDLYKASTPGYTLFTYDNQRFVVTPRPKDIPGPSHAMELLAIMYANGIDFESIDDKVMAEIIEKLAEQKRIAKENDANIRREKGFLIDANGTKVEGEISIAFDNADKADDATAGWTNVADVSSYGNKVYVYAANEKGKIKSTSYKASDKVSFEVTLAKDGKVERYEGFSYDIANKTIGFLNKLSSGSTFFKHIYGSNKLGLYYSPTERLYAIKLKDAQNGFAATRSDQDKLVTAIKEYLSCETISFDGIDLFTIEGLKKLIDNYDAQCE
ncbi:hypothetical protein AV926_05040 [Myroides marinus]|uniref:Uncharacterized protein n=1 Tax=Myroides marinus TaxID=703342 RepID=A0A161SL67_9FLAO|nr:hypothetical protein [Myroides marinus]KZE82915.1 hypothetical protein AV926_05040 [Myroides marinus]